MAFPSTSSTIRTKFFVIMSVYAVFASDICTAANKSGPISIQGEPISIQDLSFPFGCQMLLAVRCVGICLVNDWCGRKEMTDLAYWSHKPVLPHLRRPGVTVLPQPIGGKFPVF